MAGLSTGAGAPVVMVYHEKSMILPDVSRVLACLYEKDVKFECVKDSYKDILRLQASRSVPVPFYDGPTFLQESRAICRYIAETYKQRGYPFLLGKDVLERASIEQWLRHEEHAFDPPSRALFCHLAFPLHDEDDDNINREKRKLEEVLAVYEQRLGESEFLAGNKFTLADLAHLPNTHHIVTSEKFAYLYDSRKNVQRWWNTISARDSWQQVLRDMKSVKEQYQMEEYEQQQQQWQKEPPPTYGGSNIRIDSRAHTGAVSQIILVPPPSTGFIATSFPSVQQEEQPPPAKTTSHDKSSPIQQKESNFFTATEKTPTTTKTPPRTETDKSSSEDASSPTKPSQTSSKEAESKPASVGPWVDKPVSYTKPDPQTSKTPYTEPPAQRAADTSGPEAGETPSDQRSVMQTPDAQQRSEQDMMASTNQRAAARLAEKVAAKDAQGETAPQAGHHGARDITKEAREADQRKATSAPTRELPSGDQNGNQQSKAPPTDLKVSESSPLEAEFKEDAQGAMSEDERFSTKRLRKMFEESEAAVLRSQSTDLHAPEKEETPSVYKKPSDVQDRKRQAGTISADGKIGTPSTGTRDPGTPTSAEAISVPHGPSDDMLGKTSGTDQTATPAASKQTPARGEVPDVRDTSDDTTKKPAVDTKAAPTPPRQEPVSSSQQTTEQIKGVAPTSHGITGDESAKIAMADESATPPARASDGRVASTALKGGILDARVKNEAVASVADPSGMPTTPRRPAPTPDTQRRTTPDQASDQAPPFPSFAETMNEKTGIAEAGRTNTIAPNEQPGRRIPKNAGAPAAGPSPMKSQKNVNEAYNDGSSIQQLSSDQSRAQLAENKKQGDDAIPLTEIGKPKEDDFLANANQNNTGQAQVTSTDGPSKLQMQSDQNKPISSKDIGKRTNETVSYKSSATSREMLPSVPEKSMSENQLQGDKSSISLQDNVKQGSEAALSVSGTKQPKKRDLLTNVDQNSGKTPGEAIQKSEERTSSDTQQVKSNTSNSKSDVSSKPTQFGGNEGNLPESQRRGSSTSP